MKRMIDFMQFQREEIIEKLAQLEHDQWREWSQEISNSEKISPKRLERWERVWRPYHYLTEEEKEQDRFWARKVLEIFEDTWTFSGSSEIPKTKCKSCCLHRELEFCRECYTKENIILKMKFKRQSFKKYGKNCSECHKNLSQLIKLKIPLTIHHIDPDGERFDLNNVRVVCRKCHDKLDSEPNEKETV